MTGALCPGADAAEELEIADEAMIAAIDKVHAMIGAQRPHPGRLRGWLSGAGLSLLLGGVFLWLPGALLRQTATALPAAMRAAIGEAIVADLRAPDRCALRRARGAGSAWPSGCGPDRAGGADSRPARGPAVAIRLPGRIFLLGRGLIEDHDGPDLATAQLLAAAAAGDADDGVIGFLRHAGTGATFRLLTSGASPEGAASGYGAGLLAAAQRAGPVAATQAGRAGSRRFRLGGASGHLRRLRAQGSSAAQVGVRRSRPRAGARGPALAAAIVVKGPARMMRTGRAPTRSAADATGRSSALSRATVASALAGTAKAPA